MVIVFATSPAVTPCHVPSTECHHGRAASFRGAAPLDPPKKIEVTALCPDVEAGVEDGLVRIVHRLTGR